jgi:hypothetical protein
MKRPGSTPPFRTPTGEILPGSIAEIRYVRLGGLDQWAMIRGERVTNPLLLLLHGGPGFPEARLFQPPDSPIELSKPAERTAASRTSRSRGLWASFATVSWR